MNPFKRKAKSQRTPIGHRTTCRCAQCAEVAAGATREQAIAKARKWEAEMLQKHGWYVHFVADDTDSPTGFNAHTHGLEQMQDHPDFQIAIPLPEKTAHALLGTLAERVKTGERFHAGQKVEGVIEGAGGLVKLAAATECDRQVLRMILPDKHGKLDLGEIDAKFALQYEDLP